MSDVLDQIAQASTYKQEGNARFKEGNFKKALGSYHKVFCYLNGLQMPGEQNQAASYTKMMGSSNSGPQVPAENVDEVKQLKSSTHLNMAACYLKVASYSKCVDSCTKALDGGKVSKAYFRRGQAHLELRNLDEAKADFEEARVLEPSNAAITAELKRLKAAFAQHEAKEKKKFSKMFAKMADDPEPEAAERKADDAESKQDVKKSKDEDASGPAG